MLIDRAGKFQKIQSGREDTLEQGFLTGGTCTPWGYEQPNQGVRDEESEYQLF